MKKYISLFAAVILISLLLAFIFLRRSHAGAIQPGVHRVFISQTS